MSFLRMRDKLMTRGMNRRVATLATRLSRGVDTWEGIMATPGVLGLPLLAHADVVSILVAFGATEAETWHVAPSETEEVAPSDTGAGGDMHPTFNIKGTQSGRFPGS